MGGRVNSSANGHECIANAKPSGVPIRFGGTPRLGRDVRVEHQSHSKHLSSQVSGQLSSHRSNAGAMGHPNGWGVAGAAHAPAPGSGSRPSSGSGVVVCVLSDPGVSGGCGGVTSLVWFVASSDSRP